MWNGDSVQLLVDTLNAKSTEYAAGDLEMTIARTTMNGDEIYVGHAVGENKADSREEPWLKVVRSEEDNSARYLLMIPKKEMNLGGLTENMEMGVNFGVNNAFLASRENYAQFSDGLISGGKNPSLAYTFKLVGTPKTELVGSPPEAFPVKITEYE